mmetsp:Transcript_24890/g.82765  ORF Transcript_24890/g.82765 Transcript_24890/m.82765 type:complete len:377 (+) Transcript_24890:336-1466(+)
MGRRYGGAEPAAAARGEERGGGGVHEQTARNAQVGAGRGDRSVDPQPLGIALPRPRAGAARRRRRGPKGDRAQRGGAARVERQERGVAQVAAPTQALPQALQEHARPLLRRRAARKAAQGSRRQQEEGLQRAPQEAGAGAAVDQPVRDQAAREVSTSACAQDGRGAPGRRRHPALALLARAASHAAGRHAHRCRLQGVPDGARDARRAVGVVVLRGARRADAQRRGRPHPPRLVHRDGRATGAGRLRRKLVQLPRQGGHKVPRVGGGGVRRGVRAGRRDRLPPADGRPARLGRQAAAHLHQGAGVHRRGGADARAFGGLEHLLLQERRPARCGLLGGVGRGVLPGRLAVQGGRRNLQLWAHLRVPAAGPAGRAPDE